MMTPARVFAALRVFVNPSLAICPPGDASRALASPKSSTFDVPVRL